MTKKILLFLLFLLVPITSYGKVPIYHYGWGCDYCVFYDYTKEVENANILKSNVKSIGFNLNLNVITGIYLLGYDLINYDGISNIKKYFKHKIQF